MTIPFIHPSTPPRLVKRFKALDGKYHKLAEDRKVNVRYVYELIAEGKEPTDRTEKSRAIRRALFLPARKRTRSAQPKPPEWVIPVKRGIRKMAKETRHSIFRAKE